MPPVLTSQRGFPSALFTTPALLFLSRALTSRDRVNLFIVCPTGRLGGTLHAAFVLFASLPSAYLNPGPGT